MAECCTGQSECTELVTINYINSFIGNSIQDANGNPVSAKTSTTRPGNYCPTKTELTDGSIIPTFVDKGTNKWAQNVDGITVGNQGSYGANQPIKQSDLSMTYTRLNTFTITATPSTNISACGDDAKMTHTLKLTKTKKYLNSSCVATSSAETSADTTNVVTYTENVDWASIVNDTTVRIERNPSSSSTRTLTVSGSTQFRGNRVTSTTITQKALTGGYVDAYTDSSGLTKTIRCEGSSFDCDGGNYQANKIDVMDSWIVEMWEDECGVKHEDTARVKEGSHTTGEVITEIYRGSFAPCCDEAESTKTDSKTWPGYGTCSWTQTCGTPGPGPGPEPSECGNFIVDGGQTEFDSSENWTKDSCLLNNSATVEPVFNPSSASEWIETRFFAWPDIPAGKEPLDIAHFGCGGYPYMLVPTIGSMGATDFISDPSVAIFPSPYSEYPYVAAKMLNDAGENIGSDLSKPRKSITCENGDPLNTYSQPTQDAVWGRSEWKLGSVFYKVKENTGATRTAKITWRVGGKDCPVSKTFTITQFGPGEKKCESNLLPLGYNLSYGSKTNTKIGVYTSTDGCSNSWTFTSNQNWLTNITLVPEEGKNYGEIHANLTQNTGSASRTATVTGTLPGREGGSTATFTVTQDANSVTYYYYTVHSNITGATVVFNDITAGRSYTYITDGSGNATHTTTSNVSSMSFTISNSYPASNSKYIWQNNGSGSASKNTSTSLLGVRIWGDQAKYAPIIFNPSGSLNSSCTTLHYEPTNVTLGVSNQSSWIISINLSGGAVASGNASAMSASSGKRTGSFIATINGVSTSSAISVVQSDRCQ
jgi:hypothetical protein